MSYQKPQVIAKSDAKQSYVAGCPEITPSLISCSSFNTMCMCGPLQ
jgi:hypothetical protein